MRRMTMVFTTVCALLLVVFSLSFAQQGGGRGAGGGGGISAEQLLGYLALSPDIMLTDEQLLNVRDALRGPQADQQKLRAAGRDDANPQTGQQAAAELQKRMIDAVAPLLTREQNERLQTGIAQMAGGRNRGGGGRR